MKFLTPLLIVLAAAIFVRAGSKDGPWWSVQTSGLDTNLRGVAIGSYQDADGGPVPVVWVSGSNGTVLQSKDLGKTWKQFHIPGGDTLDFRGIQAFDAQTAYVMSIGEGDKSRIYKTTDGGTNWKLEYSAQRKEIFLDSFDLRQLLASVRGDQRSRGWQILLLTTADGEHWKEMPRENMPAALPNEGAFAASGTCLVYDGGAITFITGGPAARVFRSPDRGKSWTVTETPLAHGNASSGIFSIALHGEQAVVVGGDYKDTERAYRVAAYSQDAGKTWALAAQQPGGFRSAVAWVDGATLAAVGPNGEDISEDGGIHWKHTDSLNLNALAILDIQNGWAAGPKGTIAQMKNREQYLIRNERAPRSDAVAQRGH